uniref:Uncharacterized protein n=1 Tax=Arcella intermedia TaxID=1963864 RepID=A0A6B2LRX3_9EUKA
MGRWVALEPFQEGFLLGSIFWGFFFTSGTSATFLGTVGLGTSFTSCTFFTSFSSSASSLFRFFCCFSDSSSDSEDDSEEDSEEDSEDSGGGCSFFLVSDSLGCSLT